MREYGRPRRLLLNIACYLLPTVTFFSIWIPLVKHYYVPTVLITDEMLTSARLLPSDQLFETLQEFYFFNRMGGEEPQLIERADKLLRGDMGSLGYPGEKIALPFNADDIDRLPGSWQLLLAKFAVPRLFLAAYQVSKRQEFMDMARDVILYWALYERHSWLPSGLLWHDTAIAERILVLAEFWGLYRQHPAFDPEVAKIILAFAARSSQLLAKPTHYTFTSNHGIIQNLALWHFCLAFPSLPNVERYKQLTFERMQDHMAFYIDDEGVVLEHSAGYQKLGLHFTGMALRYASLLHLPPREDWIQKYERAKDFYVHLRRPDGSLPTFGDTTGGLDASRPPVVPSHLQPPKGDGENGPYGSPRHAHSIFPVAGYSIWWDGLANWPRPEQLAQTVVIWSHFPGHAHKHADEMSILLWAGGQTWWTNVGYWPYGLAGREAATSWEGSNAPHLLDEEAHSSRRTSLRSFGWSDQVAVLDLERNGPQRVRIRRQLVHLKPGLWIIVDHFPAQGNARTTWSTSHRVNLRPGEIEGSYQLSSEGNSSRMTAFILGSGATKVVPMQGNLKPFAGWEVVGAKPQPAPALVVEQSTRESWLVTVWSWQDGVTPSWHSLEQQPSMAVWNDAEHWRITLPSTLGVFDIERAGSQISAHYAVELGEDISLQLTEAQDQSIVPKFREIRHAYAIAKNKYSTYRENLASLLKMTKVLAVIFVLQETAFFIYRKTISKGSLILRSCNLIGWVGILLWLNIVRYGM